MLSMDCIWYLFFSLASFKSLESNASLIDWSSFTVMITGLIKTLSEHFSSLIILFVSKRCRISLSTFSVRCNGTLRPLCWYGLMSSLQYDVDFAIWFLDLPKRVHRWGNPLMILICIALSGWILFICIPLFWESVNPSCPSTPRPSRLTVLEFTTRISLLHVYQCPDLSFTCMAPVIGISRLLKDLYLTGHSFRSFHLADLHCCNILSASSLPMKLLGLPVSASQSISVLSEVVLIQISSDRLGEYLFGCSMLNVVGLMKFTVVQLANTSFMKNVFSRSMVSSILSDWVSWNWVGAYRFCVVALMLRTRRVSEMLCWGAIFWVCHRSFADQHTLL